MEKFITKTIANFQNYRTKKLSKAANFLITKHIQANHLTALSLITGILAVYFFLNIWWVLVLFTILHLLFDSLDGVVARLTQETLAGKYFDIVADSLPVIYLLIKVGQY